MAKKKKNIVNQKEHRYGLFVNNQSNDLDVSYGRQFIEKDNVHEVYLYKVKIVETKSHNLYGQAKAKDKIFSKPIRLNVIPTVDENDQEQYGGSGLVREDTGKLTFGVYTKELQENRIDIDRGDVVRYNMSGEKNRYYEVESANNVNDTPEYSFGGFYIYWKKIIATPVKDDAFPIDDDGFNIDQFNVGEGAETYDKTGIEWPDPTTKLIDDAPVDGETYVRKDGEWIPLILDSTFTLNVNPSEEQLLMIDSYVTSDRNITKLILESNGIINGVYFYLNLTGIPEAANLTITPTRVVIEFNEPISIKTGDRLMIGTTGEYNTSTNPTIIYGKLIY